MNAVLWSNMPRTCLHDSDGKKTQQKDIAEQHNKNTHSEEGNQFRGNKHNRSNNKITHSNDKQHNTNKQGTHNKQQNYE